EDLGRWGRLAEGVAVAPALVDDALVAEARHELAVAADLLAQVRTDLARDALLADVELPHEAVDRPAAGVVQGEQGRRSDQEPGEVGVALHPDPRARRQV